ncbi:MAG: hypothetical protein LBK82_14910 [Planctomycetaceae bacterium]|nr:hypothetical protein [Planctomycetaceae bacterium]
MTPVGMSFINILLSKQYIRAGHCLLESSKTQPAQPPSGRIAYLFSFP